MKHDYRKPPELLPVGYLTGLFLLILAFALIASTNDPDNINWQAGDGARHYHGG